MKSVVGIRVVLAALTALGAGAGGAGAATTFASSTADAYGSCATLQACRDLAQAERTNPRPPPVRAQATDTTGRPVAVGASRASGPASASSTASAGLGWLRAGGRAEGGGTVYSGAGSPMSAGAGGSASWSDSLLPNAPGNPAGAFFTFRLVVDGVLGATACGDSRPAGADLTVSLKTPAVQVPPSAGGVNNLDSMQLALRPRPTGSADHPAGLSLTRTTTQVVANGFPTVVTTFPAAASPYRVHEVFEVTHWLPMGVATTFEVAMQAGAFGSLGPGVGSTPGTAVDGTGSFAASSDFRYTLTWGASARSATTAGATSATSSASSRARASTISRRSPRRCRSRRPPR